MADQYMLCEDPVFLDTTGQQLVAQLKALTSVLSNALIQQTAIANALSDVQYNLKNINTTLSKIKVIDTSDDDKPKVKETTIDENCYLYNEAATIDANGILDIPDAYVEDGILKFPTNAKAIVPSLFNGILETEGGEIDQSGILDLPNADVKDGVLSIGDEQKDATDTTMSTSGTLENETAVVGNTGLLYTPSMSVDDDGILTM